MQIFSFKYALQHTDWLYSTDPKSGNHQARWQYEDMKPEGEVFVLPFLTFGVAPACCHFAHPVQVDLLQVLQVYLPFWRADQRLSSILYKGWGAGQPKARTMYHAATQCRIFPTLGFLDTVPNSPNDPAQTARHLGMLPDSLKIACISQNNKLEDVLLRVQQGMDRGLSDREHDREAHQHQHSQ